MTGIFSHELRRQIEGELEQARAARSAGLEGRSRVCARRSATLAIQSYLDYHHFSPPGRSALDLLNYLVAIPNIPKQARNAAQKLRMRVNEDYRLPDDMDLIDEARKLITLLDKENDP